MPTATVSSKGQITIPKEVRSTARLGAGDRVDFVLDDDGVVRLAPATRDIRSLKGIMPKPARPVTIEEMDDAIKGRASDSS